MLDDGTYTAVLDRFEADLAVLILEDDGDPVDQLDVPREDLPGSPRPDAVYRVTVEDGDPVEFVHDEDETERRREDAQSRFDRLSRRLSDARDADEDRTEDRTGNDRGRTGCDGDEDRTDGRNGNDRDRTGREGDDRERNDRDRDECGGDDRERNDDGRETDADG